MEMKIQLDYGQVLEIVKQLPINQMAKLTYDIKEILEVDTPKQDANAFQKFLLSAPTMSDEDYETFLENRKKFNQWRMKYSQAVTIPKRTIGNSFLKK